MSLGKTVSKKKVMAAGLKNFASPFPDKDLRRDFPQEKKRKRQ
jgi:hypothetical protein